MAESALSCLCQQRAGPLWESPGVRPTFGFQAIGIKVHPLLALRAAHQEARHSLSWEEGIGLRDLRRKELARYAGPRGDLATGTPRLCFGFRSCGSCQER